MTGYWKKLGLIYSPEIKKASHPKLLTHAANPLPVHMRNDVYRIYFSSRDAQNRSSVCAVDVDILQQKIIKEHTEPFIEHGPPGSFYEAGISIGNCYEVNGIVYMLFMGWQNPKNGHWRGDIGRLIVNTDLTLCLDSDQPLMGIDSTDPISLSYPWVMKDHAREGYHMWYGTTQTWDAGNAEMLHTLNYASSVDGHQWSRHGLSIPYEMGVAQAFSRPTVISNHDSYEMWFSYRSGKGETYRIGYARSYDNQKWELALNETGIDVSASGWDSEMIAYPYVFEHSGQRYMLYNGNGYGKTGFGLARWSDK